MTKADVITCYVFITDENITWDATKCLLKYTVIVVDVT